MVEESGGNGGTAEPVKPKVPKPKASTAKVVFIVVGVLLVGLCGLAFVNGKVNEQEHAFDVGNRPRLFDENKKGPVVYTIKDVPPGAVIGADAIEEKQIEAAKIPQDAVTSGSAAVGQVAKYGLSAGQIVSMHDLQLHANVQATPHEGSHEKPHADVHGKPHAKTK